MQRRYLSIPFLALLFYLTYLTLTPALLEKEMERTRLFSTSMDALTTRPYAYTPKDLSQEEDFLVSSVDSSQVKGISQVQMVKDELVAAQFSANQLTVDITTLDEQQQTLAAEISDYVTDLDSNYLKKLIKLRDNISQQKSSSSHPQIKANGLKAVNTMIEMIESYITHPNDSTYQTLGEKASRYISRAFTDVDLTHTLDIVKYLTQAGQDQVAIGLKLKDVQEIATNFLNKYGYEGSEKGEAYKKNKQQQLATQTEIDSKTAQLQTWRLKILDLTQQLEEITQ